MLREGYEKPSGKHTKKLCLVLRGRDKRRNASGSGKYAEIRRYPNGGTRHREVSP